MTEPMLPPAPKEHLREIELASCMATIRRQQNEIEQLRREVAYWQGKAVERAL